jgi:hypothetical protein
MTEKYTFPWSDDWLPVMQQILGIEGDINDLTLIFRTNDHAQAVVVYASGEIDSLELPQKKISGIKEILGLPSIAQRISLRMERGNHVVAHYQFVFVDVTPDVIARCALGMGPGAGEAEMVCE